MKAGRNRKLLRAAVSVAVYSLVKLPVVSFLMPSQVPFGHFDDYSSDAMAVTTYLLLIDTIILVAAQVCSDRIVPGTDVDDEAPGVAKDDDAEYVAVRGDPDAAAGKN